MSTGKQILIDIVLNQFDLEKQLEELNSTLYHSIENGLKAFDMSNSVIGKISDYFNKAQTAVGLFQGASQNASTTQGQVNTALSLGQIAVGLFSGQLDIATAKQAALNAVQAASPHMWLAAGIGALAAGLTALILNMEDTDAETQALWDSLEDSNKRWNELKETQTEKLSTDLAQIEHTKTLRNELDSLVETNGKIKEGKEARVQFILNQLNSALGTEYTVTEGVIDQYNEMSLSVDEMIQKKKVKAILDAQEPLYQEAINEQMKEANEISKLKSEIMDAEMEKERLQNELKENLTEEEKKRINVQLKLINSNIEDKQELLDGYKESYDQHTNEIIAFENNMTLASSENAEDWAKIQTDIQANAGTTYDEKMKYLEEERNSAQFYYDDLVEKQQNGDTRITESQLEAARIRRDEKIKEMNDLIASVQNLTPGMVGQYEAMSLKQLEAMRAYSDQYFGISQQEFDNLVSGLKSKDPEVQKQAQATAQEMLKKLESKNDQYSSIGKSVLQGVSYGLDHEATPLYTKLFNIGSTMANTFKNSLDINSPSKKFKKIAKSIPEGIEKGVLDNENDALDAVDIISSDMLERFQHIDVTSVMDKMQNALTNEQLQMQTTVQANLQHEILNTNARFMPQEPLSAKIEGMIENHVHIGDRETAVYLAPLISEELAFGFGR